MISKHSSAAFLVLVVIAIIPILFFLSQTKPPIHLTGLDTMQSGTVIITFKNILCGNDEIDPGEQCDPPGNTEQCPGGQACNDACQCPRQNQGGTSGGGQGGCPSPKNITREHEGFREDFYTCCDPGWCQEVCTQTECHVECTEGDCQRVWGLPDDWYCDYHPAVLATKVCVKAQRTYKAVTTGVCPTKRTCGALCCEIGQTCQNGECTAYPEAPEFDLPPPPEVQDPMMVAIPYTTYAFPWWYFVLAILILLFLAYLIWRKTRKLSEPLTPLKPTPPKKKRKH